MARSLTELKTLLDSLNGVDHVYIQEPSSLQYPCIVVERGSLSDVKFADNMKYRLLKRYDITVMDRAVDSGIPDQVEQLQYAEFNRYFRSDNVHHFVFQLYF